MFAFKSDMGKPSDDPDKFKRLVLFILTCLFLYLVFNFILLFIYVSNFLFVLLYVKV